MIRYNQEQLINTIRQLNSEKEELRSKLFTQQEQANNELINRLSDEYKEQAHLQKLLEERAVEIMEMKEELAKTKEELDSLYKLVNTLDK